MRLTLSGPNHYDGFSVPILDRVAHGDGGGHHLGRSYTPDYFAVHPGTPAEASRS